MKNENRETRYVSFPVVSIYGRREPEIEEGPPLKLWDNTEGTLNLTWPEDQRKFFQRVDSFVWLKSSCIGEETVCYWVS